jgi:hypothetical protein
MNGVKHTWSILNSILCEVDKLYWNCTSVSFVSPFINRVKHDLWCRKYFVNILTLVSITFVLYCSCNTLMLSNTTILFKFTLHVSALFQPSSLAYLCCLYQCSILLCEYLCVLYEGVSKSFQTELITIKTNTCWEARQRVMVAKLTRLTHKIAIQLNPVAESHTVCSFHSRWPV